MTNSSLQKLDNETQQQWMFRLLTDKIEKNIDDDWIEIRDILGLDCSPDHLRKMARGIFMFKNEIASGFNGRVENISDNEINSKIDEYKKERYKLSDVRRLQNNDLRYEARFELLHEDIVRAVRELEQVKPLNKYTLPVRKSNSSAEAIINWNDWHVGLKADNHWNVFNEDVLKQRVSHLVQKNIEHSKRHNADIVHIFINGDLLDGILHVTSRINSTINAVEQTQLASELMCDAVSQLANEFHQVKLYFAKGNHERVHSSKHDAIAKESFFEFIPWFMKARLRKFENVSFEENIYDHEIINATVCGLSVFAVHGHRDSVGKVVQDITLMTGVKPYSVYTAHIHQYGVKEVHGVYVFTSPSLSGVDTYAKENRLTGNAGQLMSIYDNSGEICTYNIRFQ